MNELATTVIEFLFYSSIQILLVSLIAGVLLTLGRIKGKVTLWSCRLILLLPLLYLLSHAFPHPIETPFAERLQHQAHDSFSLPAPIAVPPGGEELFQYPAIQTDSTPINTPSSQRADAKPTVPAKPALLTRLYQINWPPILFSLWLFFLLTRLFQVGYRLKLHRQQKSSSPPLQDPLALEILTQCCREMGLRKIPQVRVSDRNGIPYLAGVFQPWILIPAFLLHPQKREALRYTFLHELSHLRQRDHWWIVVESGISLLYCFHPAVHWLRKRIRKEQEYICDQKVVELSRNKTGYAEFLLQEVLEANRRFDPHYALSILFDKTSISRRIHDILQERKNSMFNTIYKRMFLGGIVAGIIGLLYFFPTVTTAQNQSDETSVVRTEGAPVPANEKTMEDDTAFATVIGSVVEEGSGKPLADVYISRVDLDENRNRPVPKLMRVKSGSDGHFKVRGLKENEYALVANKVGYAPFFFSYRFPKNSQTASESIQIKLSPTDINVEVQLQFEKKDTLRDSSIFWVRQKGRRYVVSAEAVNGKTDTYRMTGIESSPARIVVDAFGVGYRHQSPSVEINPIDGTTIFQKIELNPLIMVRFTLPNDFEDIPSVGVEIPTVEDRFLSDLNLRKMGNTISIFIPMGNHEFRFAIPEHKPINYSFEYKGEKVCDGVALDFEKGEYPSNFGGIILFDESLHRFPVEEYKRLWNYRKGESTVFSLPQYYDEITSLMLFDQNDKVALYLEASEWIFDSTAQQIKLVSNNLQNPAEVHVKGKVSFPWAWRLVGYNPAGDVDVLVNGRVAEEGKDYQINREEKTLTFSPELSQERTKYGVVYPGLGTGSYANRYAFGNLSPEEYNKIKGIKSEPQPPRYPGSVGASATQTDDPSVYYLFLVMDPERMNIGIANRKMVGDIQWLKRGEDYGYDPATSKIHLTKKIDLDPKNDFLFVDGVPKQNEIIIPNLVKDEKVEVTVDDRKLEAGKDYEINYETGKVIILTVQTNSKYLIKTEHGTYGKDIGNFDKQDKTIVVPRPKKQNIGSIGINAEPTGDSTVYNLIYIIREETLQVAVSNPSQPDNPRWLKKWIDFSYDPERSQIHLLRNIELMKNDYLMAVGVPIPYVFMFQKLKQGDPVEVTVDGYPIRQFNDFTVDYKIGKVTLLPRLQTGDQKVSIQAGDVSFRNY